MQWAGQDIGQLEVDLVRAIGVNIPHSAQISRRAVLGWMRALRAGQAVEWREARALVVGRELVGKTWWLRAMASKDGKTAEIAEEERTGRIEVSAARSCVVEGGRPCSCG